MDRAAIEARFRSDMEAAEAFREANPERYAEMRFAASERKSDGLAALAEAADNTARAATLSTARTNALAQFPLADPGALNGSTAEEITASAQRSHDFIKGQRESALQADREARRPGTRQQWTGSETGTRVGAPGGERMDPPTPRAQQQVNAAYDRTAEIIGEARKPGTLRSYSEDTTRTVLRSDDPEAQMLADHQVLTPNTGLSLRAMKAKAEGTVVYAGPGQDGKLADEDRRG